MVLRYIVRWKNLEWGKIGKQNAICQFFTCQLLLYIITQSFIYICSLFTNILPSNWFRLAHLPIFYPSKVFPLTVVYMVIVKCFITKLLKYKINLCLMIVPPLRVYLYIPQVFTPFGVFDQPMMYKRVLYVHPCMYINTLWECVFIKPSYLGCVPKLPILQCIHTAAYVTVLCDWI